MICIYNFREAFQKFNTRLEECFEEIIAIDLKKEVPGCNKSNFLPAVRRCLKDPPYLRSAGEWILRNVIFPAITPLYIPVWMNERAECSQNRHPWHEVKCQVQNKNRAMKLNFMTSLPDSNFVLGSDIIHCRILILYPAVTNSLKKEYNK